MRHKLILIIAIILAMTHAADKQLSDEIKKKMFRYPSGYRGKQRLTGKVTPWIPESSGLYAPHKGQRPPHRLDQDALFFIDFNRYLKWNSKFWTYVLFPFKLSWHGSSVLYMNYFAYKYKDTGHYPGNPFSTLQYINDEGWFRALILWIFWPWLLMFYWLPVRKIRDWIMDDQ